MGLTLAELYVVVGSKLDDFERGMAEVDRRISALGAATPAIDLAVDSAEIQRSLAEAETAMQRYEAAVDQVSAKITSTVNAAAQEVTGIEWLGPGREFLHTAETDAQHFEAQLKKTTAAIDDEATALRKKAAAEAAEAKFQREAIELEKKWQAAQAEKARSLAEAEMASRKAADGLREADKQVTRATPNFGKFNAALATLASQAVGANPIVVRLANTVSSFALSSAMTAGVLAGLAAVGFAWERWTARAREAEKAATDALKVIDDLVKKRREVETGSLGLGLEELDDRIAKARAALKLAQLPRTVEMGFGDRMTLPADVEAVRKAQEALDELLLKKKTATEESAKITEDAGKRERATYVSTLAALVATGKATEAELKRARQLQEEDLREAAKLPKTDAAREERVRLLAEAKELGDAFDTLNKPKKIPEIDKIVQQLREQTIELEKGAHAAYEYSLSINKQLTPTQRKLALATFDALAAAKAQTEADEKASEALKQHAKAIADTIRGLEDENLKLTNGEAALLEHTLRLEGATDAQIEHALAILQANDAYEKMQKSMETAGKRVEDALEKEEKRLQSVADTMAGSVVDTILDIVTGADDAAHAFGQMINSMIRDLLRFAAQKSVIDPLTDLFKDLLKAGIGSVGGASGSSTTSPLTVSKPWIGPTASVTAMSGPTVHVHQAVGITVQALDSRTAYDVIQQNAPAIHKVMIDGVRNSDAIARAMRGA